MSNSESLFVIQGIGFNESPFAVDSPVSTTSTSTTLVAANSVAMGTLNLGIEQGVNLNLLAPYVTQGGKVYYLLDTDGNGVSQIADSLGHDVLDKIFNNGSDTFDTQASGAVIGVDDARTMVKSGYTVVLPTTTEFIALRTELGNQFPAGWQPNDYDSPNFGTATRVNANVHHNVSFKGNTTYTNLYDGYYNGMIILQVLGTNAAPVLGTPTALSYTDTAGNDSFVSATGNLIGTDANNDALSYGVSGGAVLNGFSIRQGIYGTLSVNTSTGAYSFEPNDSAIEGLKLNASEIFEVTVADGKMTTSADLIVNLTGTNDAPTGGVTISGLATQGQTLTASNTLADVEGMGAVQYQWLADGNVINGANTETFTLTQAQVGKAISVRASYSDQQGSAESVTSPSTTPVVLVYGGHSYTIVDGPTWEIAQAKAVELGGNLVTINDAQEEAWLMTNFVQGDGKAYWIGLSDQTQEGQWVWSSGDQSAYRNWFRDGAVVAPDNRWSLGEDFAVIGWDARGWNDVGYSPEQPGGVPALRGIVEIAPVIYGAVTAQLAYSGDTPVIYEAWNQRSFSPLSRSSLIWNEGRSITDMVRIRYEDYSQQGIHFDIDAGAALELAPMAVDVTGWIMPWMGFSFIYEQTAAGIRIVDAWAADYHGDLPAVASAGGSAPYITTSMNSLPVGQLNLTGGQTVGSVLTVRDNITDEEGVLNKRYIWSISETEYQPQGPTYTIQPGDVGRQISVWMEYTDQEGVSQRVRSELVTAQQGVALLGVIPGTSQDVAPGTNFSLKFDAPVRAGEGLILLTNQADPSDSRSISITDTSQIAFRGAMLVINPASDLAPNATYAITMPVGAVLGTSGQVFEGLSPSAPWTFSTGSTTNWQRQFSDAPPPRRA